MYPESMPEAKSNIYVTSTSCVGLQEEEAEPQTTHPMCFTWVSHIATSMLWDVKLLPDQLYVGNAAFVKIIITISTRLWWLLH